MLEYYAPIKSLHLFCVVLSGLVFTTRGLLMLLRSPWAQHVVGKWLSYINDSILLTAGLLLMQITRQTPVTHDWLTVKLSLLVVYIVLGIFALRRGRTLRTRAACFVAALMTYLFMFSIARAHHPMGIIQLLQN